MKIKGAFGWDSVLAQARASDRKYKNSKDLIRSIIKDINFAVKEIDYNVKIPEINWNQPSDHDFEKSWEYILEFSYKTLNASLIIVEI